MVVWRNYYALTAKSACAYCAGVLFLDRPIWASTREPARRRFTLQLFLHACSVSSATDVEHGGVAALVSRTVVSANVAKLSQFTGTRKAKSRAIFVAVLLAAFFGGVFRASAADRTVAYAPIGYQSVAATLARAQRGEPAAETRLGWLFSTGRGVPQNYYEAAKWFYRAATRGNGTAQFALGMLYNKGQGVPRDYVLSYLWLSFSAAQSVGADRDFKARMRDAIASKMTPRQLSTAQEMALAWYGSR
jgi:uncharacterized protein